MTEHKKKPIYQHIVEDLKRKIKHGEITPDQPLPTQIELARMYNTSEISSRRALTELVNEGLIYRVRGKGSFLNHNSDMLSSNRLMEIRKVYLLYRGVNLHMFNHRFYDGLLSGIHEVCEDNGVDFHIWEVGQNHELPPEEDEIGLICLPHVLSLDKIKLWKEENRRIVTVHFYYPHLQLPYVIGDNLTGGYLATEHLLSLGHKRIGVILTGKSRLEMNQEFTLRLEGYKLALSQHRIELDPDLVSVVIGDQEMEEMGEQGLAQLLELPNPPTAVFATSDYKALGAMRTARKLGLSIPADLSIVGYDDIMMSQYALPSLTTLNQNSETMGRRAAEILLFEWHKDIAKDEIVPKLIVRDSTSEWQE
nr:GntR family transcriptional regulator [Paenibacillus senegalensis]